MRDILFRGLWVHGNKEWIEGDLVRDSEGNPHIVDNKYAAYWGGESIFVCEDECEVIPETVGQYTGLIDKNGKKVFEGDICRFREWSKGDMCWVGKVHYEHQQFVISGNPNKECESEFLLVMSRFIPENIEIIGNVFDNPELLEVK
jgi:uncharacterized phage protein (TIGR01671 family)